MLTRPEEEEEEEEEEEDYITSVTSSSSCWSCDCSPGVPLPLVPRQCDDDCFYIKGCDFFFYFLLTECSIMCFELTRGFLSDCKETWKYIPQLLQTLCVHDCLNMQVLFYLHWCFLTIILQF